MVRSALKTFVIGASSVSCLAFVANHLYADEKNKSLINIRKDTISSIPDNPFKGEQNEESFQSLVQATRAARDLCQQTMAINGYPGVVAGVSIKGEPCWVQGFGFADIEAGTRCNKNTVMRIASISKPITMAAVAKLYELGKLDLDKNIYEYLGDKFPEKRVDGEKVTITIRQLASHLGGIRHYKKDEVTDISLFRHKPYKTAVESLETFAKDDLISKPGTQFEYSTFGYTLIAAAVEMAEPTVKSFGRYLVENICRRTLGMRNTYLDENSPIILNRAKQYTKSSVQTENAPLVECSYKYAGGGLLSTVPDLLRFGNAMMYSYLPYLAQSTPFLKKSTVDMLWTPVPFELSKEDLGLFPKDKYALGWNIVADAKDYPLKDIIFHTGDATGGTTLLMIIPEKEMTIALICNVKNARGLKTLGLSVAQLFANVKLPAPIAINPKEIVAKE